jgi:hypothetical protein
MGIYGEYFRWGQGGDINLAGLGGRLSVNVARKVQLEGEIGYDFEQAFTESFGTSSGGGTGTIGGTITTVRSRVRLLHGMFGPKLQTHAGALRLFVTAKGGFDDFMFSNRPATLGTFFSAVGGVRSTNVNAVFYPGGGMEAFLGPIGLRLDVGDEIYFNNGAHNNLRVAFGPHIRF